MKVLIGTFVTESNANVPNMATIANYDIAFGDELIQKMGVKDIYDDAGIDLVPSIYADAGGHGVVSRNAFDYIESCFVKSVKEHLHELDGIYLFLHGASEVEGLGSGDHHIMKSIREITGPYFPIAVACDPHGNLCQEYADNCTIIRSYRESPHTDAQQTKRTVSKMLCELLHHRQNIRSIYRKLPLILGGEQSVSTDEPVLSINKYMDEMEKDERIRSASWHVGYLRHDCDVAGCGIIVVPNREEDIPFAEEKADELAKFVWDRRHEFHYTGLTAQPDEALKMALEKEGKPVFITDSGDNTTSGAPGWNTYVLRQFLGVKDLKKRVIFATIHDPKTYKQLLNVEDGQDAHIALGVNFDEWSAPVELDVTVKCKGPITGFMYRDHNKAYAHCVVVNVKGTPIDIMVADGRFAVVEIHQFADAGCPLENYDIAVVKQGYIFPELKEIGALCVMSLTMGATPQDTRNIPFKRIMRPMYPIDEI